MVGRISAHLNPVHDATHNERGGFFGFFESIDDPAVAQALLESAEDWLAQHQVDWVRGPISFTMNQEVGILSEGWDTPPTVGMAHSRDYYPALMEGAGYRKAKDLYAWSYALGTLNKRLAALYDRVAARPNVHIREFERKHFHRDVRIAAQIFNEGWADNWGFVPISEAEADQLADDLNQFASPGTTSMIEIDGEPAAMVVGVPDLNHVIRDIDGRLFPLRGDQAQVAPLAWLSPWPLHPPGHARAIPPELQRRRRCLAMGADPPLGQALRLRVGGAGLGVGRQ